MRSQNPRKTPLRRQTVLIVGEGVKTEYNYFSDIRLLPEVRSRFEIDVKKGGNSAPSIVNTAIELANRREIPYTKVWCVLDVESQLNYPKIEEARTILRKNATAKKNSMELCLSNPCFEIWLLAHFENTSKPFNGCQPIKSLMDKHWEPVFKHKYEENTEGIFTRLRESLPAAIEHATALLPPEECAFNKNSSTEVYRIIKWLDIL